MKPLPLLLAAAFLSIAASALMFKLLTARTEPTATAAEAAPDALLAEVAALRSEIGDLREGQRATVRELEVLRQSARFGSNDENGE